MKTKGNRLENYLFDFVIQVWDPSIQQIIHTYDSEKRAANALGVGYKTIMGCYTRKDRLYSPMLGKEITCRAKNKTPDMVFNKQGILITSK
jgi:hypothetical protein